MQGLLNRSNLDYADNIGNNGGIEFNCWGGTLFVLGKIEELKWVYSDDMEMFLEENTKVIDEDKLQIGDILALYDCNGLVHTATHIGNNEYWHKKGSCRSEFTSKQEVLNCYDYDDYEIRRLI